MRILSPIFGSFLIILLVATLLFFLNPFMWGMRSVQLFELPKKIMDVEMIIKKDSVFENYSYVERPTLWYIKDCERGHLEEIENLKIHLGEVSIKAFPIDSTFLNNKIDSYASKIIIDLPKKMCFDSLVFRYSYVTKGLTSPTVVKTRKYQIQNSI